MPRRADRHNYRSRIADGDGFLPRGESGVAIGGEVMRWVFRIELFDEEVLNVGRGGRKAPGDLVVMADDDHWVAGDRRSGDLAARRLEPGEVPHARRTEAEMRVVGEKRFAAGAMGAVDHPIVGGILRAKLGRQRGVETSK